MRLRVFGRDRSKIQQQKSRRGHLSFKRKKMKRKTLIVLVAKSSSYNAFEKIIVVISNHYKFSRRGRNKLFLFSMKSEGVRGHDTKEDAYLLLNRISDQTLYFSISSLVFGVDALKMSLLPSGEKKEPPSYPIVFVISTLILN